MKRLFYCAAVVSSMSIGSSLADTPKLAWETQVELNNPESALYDAQRGVVYVSNVNGAPNEADGNGYITMLLPSGEVAEQQWVAGLDAPKGLAMHGGKLYVADITRLVEIDIASAQITNRYDGDGAQFLNDVTADAAGNVYVSDMMGNKIYRLNGGEFSVWLEDAGLENPNGLHAEGDKLIVGSWGVMTDGFKTAVPGHLKTVSTTSGAIESLGNGTPVGNLDGVEADGQGNYYVTDWLAGKLFQIMPSGQATEVLDLGQGSADHEFLEETGLVIVPLMMKNKVVAYRLK